MTELSLTDIVRPAGALPKNLLRCYYYRVRDYVCDGIVALIEAQAASNSHNITNLVDVDYSNIRISTVCDAGVSVEK